MASLLAGLATGVGALLVFFVRQVSDRFLDAALGFAAGVMLAATSFSLIVPAIAIGGIWKTVVGIV
ncbi:MAG: ZIP family metal transporter, partial [Deltaproteobacteria bacterium]|nr:ZIP family metal transporter [Deltaproteobacteria bacterium]